MTNDSHNSQRRSSPSSRAGGRLAFLGGERTDSRAAYPSPSPAEPPELAFPLPKDPTPRAAARLRRRSLSRISCSKYSAVGEEERDCERERDSSRGRLSAWWRRQRRSRRRRRRLRFPRARERGRPRRPRRGRPRASTKPRRCRLLRLRATTFEIELRLKALLLRRRVRGGGGGACPFMYMSWNDAVDADVDCPGCHERDAPLDAPFDAPFARPFPWFRPARPGIRGAVGGEIGCDLGTYPPAYRAPPHAVAAFAAATAPVGRPICTHRACAACSSLNNSSHLAAAARSPPRAASIAIPRESAFIRPSTFERRQRRRGGVSYRPFQRRLQTPGRRERVYSLNARCASARASSSLGRRPVPRCLFGATPCSRRPVGSWPVSRGFRLRALARSQPIAAPRVPPPPPFAWGIREARRSSESAEGVRVAV